MINLDEITDVYKDLLQFIKESKNSYHDKRITNINGIEVTEDVYNMIKIAVLGELSMIETFVKKRLKQVEFIKKYEG